MVNYSEALKRPFTDMKALVIGIILVLIPIILGFLFIGGTLLPQLPELAALEGVQDSQVILDTLFSTVLTPGFFGIMGLLVLVGLIINMIVGGYYYRCISSMLTKSKKKYNMPKWDKWGDLFVKGLLFFVISMIYAIILVVLMVLTALTVVGPLILMILFIYILPSILISFVKEGRFGGAFKFGIIFRKAFTKTYFVAWVFMIAVVIVLGVISSFIPLIGPTIAGFLSVIIGFTALTEAYSEIKK